ncbi:hemolysin family protein, partial [Bacillus songklensis]
MEFLNLIIFAILIVLTAFFVATEFSIIRVRSTRIDQLIAEGNKNAVAAKRVVSNLDEYLSACQLGITITALGMGWLGEPTVARLIDPLFEKMHMGEPLSHILSFVIAFTVVTFINVVVGELAPKTVAIQKAEQVTLLFSRPIILFYKVLYPFIWVLNHSARGVAGLFGLKPASEHEVALSEEELRIILSESYESGEINQSEFKYVNNIFEFDDRTAREIMVPRTEIISVSKDDTIEDFLNIAGVEKHTRYPVVVEGDKDQVIGLVNIKEILTDFVHEKGTRKRTVGSYVKPIIEVIESIPIYDLLIRMQKNR